MPLEQPRGIAETAWAMAGLNLLGYSLIDGTAKHLIFNLVVVSLGTFVAYFVLWFYWKGRNWARWLVMLTSLIALSNIRLWSSYGPVPRVMIALEAVLGTFLLYWLNTRPVRTYFAKTKIATHL